MMKKILIFAAIAFGGYKLFDKKQAIDGLKEALRIVPKNIRNVQFAPGGLQMTMDLQLINDSPMEFALNAFGAIKITKINFYNPEGELVATANTNISNIAIAPNSTMDVPNVLTNVQLKGIAGNVQQLFSGDITTTVEVSILGQKYVI